MLIHRGVWPAPREPCGCGGNWAGGFVCAGKTGERLVGAIELAPPTLRVRAGETGVTSEPVTESLTACEAPLNHQSGRAWVERLLSVPVIDSLI